VVATLGTYVYPVFGELPVQAIDTMLVMKPAEYDRMVHALAFGFGARRQEPGSAGLFCVS
jgi:hypothetical protein